jgi:hypothetical protein
MLEFSRMRHSALEFATVDMEHLVASVIEELAPAYEGCSISFTHAPLPPVQGDPIMLHQVMVNLLSNAIKFTKTRATAIIAVEGERIGDEVSYRVRDNGVGFNMRHAGRLFKVFQRLHSAAGYKGAGVGLALVQRIIDRHGGHISVESEEGKGTVFHFTLPARPKQTA